MGTRKGAGILAGLLLAAFATVAMPVPGHAQSAPAGQAQQAPPVKKPAPITDPNALKCANAVCLAYITSPSAQVNDDAQKGLEAVQEILKKRTVIKPEAVIGLNIEQADLSLFRLIYWPITRNTPALSEAAQQKVKKFLNSGGIIMFDTMGESNNEALQRVLGQIEDKPLVPIGKDHTLKKAFYKLASMQGTNDYDSKVFVEASGSPGAENVTSVVIGDNNWAGAWAGRTLPLVSRERELALRTAVNVAAVAYAGDFKSDPVQATLQKLGK